jgi:hypothetical protein
MCVTQIKHHFTLRIMQSLKSTTFTFLLSVKRVILCLRECVCYRVQYVPFVVFVMYMVFFKQ